MYIYSRIQREPVAFNDPNNWEDRPVQYYAIEFVKPDGTKGFKDTQNMEEATKYEKKPNKSKYNDKMDNYGGYKIEQVGDTDESETT